MRWKPLNCPNRRSIWFRFCCRVRDHPPRLAAIGLEWIIRIMFISKTSSRVHRFRKHNYPPRCSRIGIISGLANLNRFRHCFVLAVLAIYTNKKYTKPKGDKASHYVNPKRGHVDTFSRRSWRSVSEVSDMGDYRVCRCCNGRRRATSHILYRRQHTSAGKHKSWHLVRFELAYYLHLDATTVDNAMKSIFTAVKSIRFQRCEFYGLWEDHAKLVGR